MITVVGIGADGWDGLPPESRRVLEAAEVLMGASRQLGLVPRSRAERVAWPSPLLPALPALMERYADRQVCVLASGDPMFYGIGSTLVRLLGAARIRVLPHLSSLSLACARLGWPVEQVDVVSLVGRPLAALNAAVLPGRRVLVLGAGRDTPALVAGLLAGLGYGPSPMTVLSDLGAASESVRTGTAEKWAGTAAMSALQVIAVECVAGPGAEPFARVPGLPDTAFEHDGQLTKREVRAVSLSRLAPLPGELLWDVGAGAGSIAVEWLRAHSSNAAVAVESRADRVAAIRRNADRLGVPALRVVEGRAPVALEGLLAPDAVFVGGGATAPGMLETCWAALRPGGRLVVNAVTLESESVVAGWYARLGGDLVRLSVQRAAPVGGFTGWRAAMPVTVWSITRKDVP
ncbi:precorrin-6y C5,15-methyltransferase (decarboxylating) subunit CbiE [Nonomuraea sp. NPDC050022]|uniref:precorrin-6y C5,15-methyltransferase (decarboxylating) subunit CbiE n=1 Tax=Nonomuraea sp. NPDC050022 TaxID=3364358 RepID=UPI00378FAFB9